MYDTYKSKSIAHIRKYFFEYRIQYLKHGLLAYSIYYCRYPQFLILAISFQYFYSFTALEDYFPSCMSFLSCAPFSFRYSSSSSIVNQSLPRLPCFSSHFHMLYSCYFFQNSYLKAYCHLLFSRLFPYTTSMNYSVLSYYLQVPLKFPESILFIEIIRRLPSNSTFALDTLILSYVLPLLGTYSGL